MIRRRVHAFSGFEFDWLACDEEGFVAMFSSAGFGPVPEAALAIADSLDEALDHIKALPITGDTTPTLPDSAAFAEVLAATLRDGAEISTYAQIEGLLYPDDPEVLLGALVPATDAWVPTVGLAFAHALERGGVASLRRLGPRYLAAADARGMVGEGTLD